MNLRHALGIGEGIAAVPHLRWHILMFKQDKKR